jgi:hypothetical protein
MALNLARAVIGYLKEWPEQKFTARQLAEWVFKTYPDECQEKRANSRGDYIRSDADLVQQLVAEISSQRPRMQAKHPELKTTEGRPRRYYYSERSDSAEVAAVESEGASVEVDASASKIDEHALVPLAVAISVGGVRHLLQTHRREAFVEQARPQRQPLALPGRGWNGGLRQGVAPRSARLCDAVFRQAHKVVVVRGQAANQPFERPRVLLSGRIELIMGQLRLSGLRRKSVVPTR